MKNAWIFLCGAAAGAVCGAMASRGYYKSLYEKAAKADIESVIETFRGKKPDEPPKEEPEADKVQEEAQDSIAYREIVSKLYAPQDEDIRDVMKPYVIAPEEFGVKEGYDTVSLSYYADGTLADDRDRAMSDNDIEATVGRASLQCFGMHEEDSVHVRNDQTRCDYEILIDLRSYDQVLEEKPYLARE